jgi:HD superfamily phosphohydrolase
MGGKTNGLEGRSSIKEISPIKDVIHGYISLSALEKIVIDSPQFQRLHFIWQNSSTYTAYPNNKNSRFSHSLGVAHLAGEIFRNSIANASRAALDAAIQEMDKVVGAYAAAANLQRDNLEAGWMSCAGKQFQFHHQPHDRTQAFRHMIEAGQDNGKLGFDPLFLLNTYGVALRVCGLVHDIGHLPMSHIFETALADCERIFDRFGDTPQIKEVFRRHLKELDGEVFSRRREDAKHRKRYLTQTLGIGEEEFDRFVNALEIHEKRGQRIFDEICHFCQNDHVGENQKSYILLVFHLAKVILFSKSGVVPKAGNLSASLREIISGAVDADRLDYTLRDPLESGVTDRTFDVERLTSQMVLLYDIENKAFSLCAGYKSLSVLETFFHSRFLNYRFIIYHHSVIRMNCVLSEIIGRIIRICYVDPYSPVAIKASQLGLVSIDNSKALEKVRLLDSLSQRILDEAWLRTLMLEILDVTGSFDGGRERELCLLIETFIFRRTQNLKTMWKSEIEFLRLSDNYPQLKSFQPRISHPDIRGAILEVIERANKKNKGRIITFAQFLDPKIYRRSKEPIGILDDLGKVWEASELSPYLASLEDISARSPNLHVSFFAENLKGNNTLEQECAMIEADIVAVLLKHAEAAEAEKDSA